MVTGEQVDFVVLDHISIAISGLDIKMSVRLPMHVLPQNYVSLVEETGVGMLVVSHLRRTDGTPAEEGGRTFPSHLRGYRLSHSFLMLCGVLKETNRMEGGEEEPCTCKGS